MMQTEDILALLQQVGEQVVTPVSARCLPGR